MSRIKFLLLLMFFTTNYCISQTSQKILEKVEKSTVFIYVDFVQISPEGVKIGKSMGSGFLISSEGYVITNAHVINLDNIVNKVNIIYDNSKNYTAEIVRLDLDYDLALLKINSTEIFANYLSIRNDADIKDGSEVNFIGYPLQPNFQQQSISLRASVSKGLINRKKQRTNITSKEMEIFEISADANPGNSGGPSFDSKTGEVVGVITKRLSIQSTGISFAVPAKYLFPLLELNIIIKNRTTLLDTDLIVLIQSLVYELDENIAKISRNSSIFSTNIDLIDSGKVLIANPILLEKPVWENTKINKITLLNKLSPESNLVLKNSYISIADYNELVNSRNKYLLENQAMTNYNDRRIQNEKSLLEVGSQIERSLTSAIEHLNKLIE